MEVSERKKRNIQRKIDKLKRLVRKNKEFEFKNETISFLVECYETPMNNQMDTIERIEKKLDEQNIISKKDFDKMNEIWSAHKKWEEKNKFKAKCKEYIEKLVDNSIVGNRQTNKNLVKDFSEKYFNYIPNDVEIDKFLDHLFEMDTNFKDYNK